jgi:hypothetical protein
MPSGLGNSSAGHDALSIVVRPLCGTRSYTPQWRDSLRFQHLRAACAIVSCQDTAWNPGDTIIHTQVLPSAYRCGGHYRGLTSRISLRQAIGNAGGGVYSYRPAFLVGWTVEAYCPTGASAPLRWAWARGCGWARWYRERLHGERVVELSTGTTFERCGHSLRWYSAAIL